MYEACSSGTYYNLAMLKALLIGAVLLFGQEPKPASGVIAGSVTVPMDRQLSQPVQVVLLTARYAALWDTDVLKRLDTYWERYKPVFIQNREFFIEISRKAQIEALDYVVGRMRRDQPGSAAEYVQQAGTEGRFEFKSIPFGEYKILAVGKAENVDLVWQESVEVRNPIPQFLELKQTLP